MSERIPLCEPCLGGNARQYLEECLASNFVSSVGPFVERFERAFADFVGTRYAVACASGTAALHVAMRLCEARPGDEVFVPTFTFVASANPVLYERLTPVLFDAEAVTWNIDAELVVDELERRARVGQRMPKAIEVVHVLGHPAHIEPIQEACLAHGIMLIEDAAEALGARYKAGRFAGRQVGSVGHVGCFSFNGNKVMTTGGGGMLVTDDEALAKRAKHLTTQARTHGRTAANDYFHDDVGYNYRLSNLAAALGVAQLERLQEFLDLKRRIAERYDAAFASLSAVERPPWAAWAEPSHWLYSVQLSAHARRTRDAVILALSERGIETRPVWTPLHQMPMYREVPRVGGLVADGIHARTLSIPTSVSLTGEVQDRVIAALRDALVGASSA